MNIPKPFLNQVFTVAVSLFGLGLPLLGGMALPAIAQSNLVDLGQAVGGQRVRLDISSIRRASDRSVDFTYYLGNDSRYSQANCENGSWTTFEDGVVHTPQSGATNDMIRIVCQGSSRVSVPAPELRWFVFAPPSNVRVSPNGAVQCVIREQRNIDVLGVEGSWYITNACGSRGYIHNSQIEPID